MSQPLYHAQNANNPVSVGRDSVVVTATATGWSVRWSNNEWGEGNFRTCPDRPLGPSQLSAPWVSDLFPRGKAAGAWYKPPTLI